MQLRCGWLAARAIRPLEETAGESRRRTITWKTGLRFEFSRSPAADDDLAVSNVNVNDITVLNADALLLLVLLLPDSLDDVKVHERHLGTP